MLKSFLPCVLTPPPDPFRWLSGLETTRQRRALQIPPNKPPPDPLRWLIGLETTKVVNQFVAVEAEAFPAKAIVDKRDLQRLEILKHFSLFVVGEFVWEIVPRVAFAKPARIEVLAALVGTFNVFRNLG